MFSFLLDVYLGVELMGLVETMEQQQIGKGVRQGCILSPCLFNFSTEYIKVQSQKTNQTDHMDHSPV